MDEAKPKYSVYVLKSLKSDIHYIGQTKDLDKRLFFHNSENARWTKRYQPWVLIYNETFDTRSEAMKRERYLKNQKDIARYLKIVKNESSGVESSRS